MSNSRIFFPISSNTIDPDAFFLLITFSDKRDNNILTIEINLNVFILSKINALTPLRTNFLSFSVNPTSQT